ncbi:MAG: sigma-70 family RNA polymerase sigma factor [Planctomycetes bacterium]|nr:sigma-70 family RNA polymerase sigma factor [Planctomycetota bacterium]
MDQATLDELLRRAKRRDATALETLVEVYSPRVFGLLYRLTGARQTAEDLLQETFLRVVRTIDSYEHSGKFEAWLFRIAANLARDRARRLRRRGPTASLEAGGSDVGEPAKLGTAAPEEERPDQRLLRREAEQRLRGSLAQLSDAEREIVLLRHFSELSFREIADILGVPLGTALARAHRALNRLRNLLGDET